MLRHSLRAGVIALLFLAAAPAAAEWRPSGAATGQFLWGPGSEAGADVGGTSVVDLWQPFGAFRAGGALGVFAVTSPDGERSRVAMPFALSLAYAPRFGPIELVVRVRAGAWGGATNQGLAAGGFGTAGAFVGWALDEAIALHVGCEVWGVLGSPDALLVAPGLAMAWTLRE